MNELEDDRQMSNSNNDEQPRKYLRRDHDISTGVTTRARKREQEMNPTTEISTSTETTTQIDEQCSICLNNLLDQEVGIPENCEHIFCLTCILKWSKTNNSCPIDRKAFHQIRKKKSFRCAEFLDSIKVKDNRRALELEENFLEMINDDISCRVCGRDDQEDVLLICDDCGNGYHTFCLGLPAVPNTPEWMCPLCEVDQLSAEEDLYPESDLEELQEILIDMEENAADENRTNARPNRVRQTARMRTGALRNQRATTTTTTTAATTTNTNTRRRRRPRRQATATRTRVTRRARRRPDSGAAAATRRLNPRQQQRRRLRQERIAQDQIHRRIENVNAVSRDEPVSTRGITIRSEAPRLSIYGDEPVAFDDEPTTTNAATTRPVISQSEAARRIAESGIPILSRSRTQPSISRELSLQRHTINLDRIPSRTIRPAAATNVRTRPPPSPPQVPIHQLPRIRRRADAPIREPSRIRTIQRTVTAPTPSFLDNLLNSQERLHTLQNIRLHGPHIEIS